jgi:hypothetical protein
MKTLRAAERQLQAARRKRNLESVFALHAHVEALRTRTDLLLAKAVEGLHLATQPLQRCREAINLTKHRASQ